ncbi:MAG: DNA gyrase inhibitor YacG [Verrucomicrobiota bacterium]
MAALIQCPICGRENDFFAEPTGPFCSSRCKQIDLGKWLGEDYRIPGSLSPEALEEAGGDGPPQEP